MSNFKKLLRKVAPVRASVFAAYRNESNKQLSKLNSQLTKQDAMIASLKQQQTETLQLLKDLKELRAEWQSYTFGYDYERTRLPEERSAEIRRNYQMKMGKELDLDNPKTYNEKVQYRKMNDPIQELKTKLTDKLEVRKWVAAKIGDEYLIPLYDVWEHPDDIDLTNLPNEFALKANHGCGMVECVRNKEIVNLSLLQDKAANWLSKNFAFANGFEMQYATIRPLVYAEKLLQNNDDDLFDYKFWCFNGKVEYIMFLSDRSSKLHMSFYDRNWNLQNFSYSYPRHDKPIPRPENLEIMIQLSEKLAEGFDHVRIDLYDTPDDGIKFGEMTFSTASGYCNWEPEEADANMGKLWQLS